MEEKLYLSDSGGLKCRALGPKRNIDQNANPRIRAMIPEAIAGKTMDNADGDDVVLLLPPSISLSSEHPQSTTRSVDWNDVSPDSSWRANVFMVRQENVSADTFRAIHYTTYERHSE